MMDRRLGLYVHWPYCAAICPYCDFNVYKARSLDSEPLVEAILADMAYWRDQTGKRALTSLFFGGGTPSLMAPGQVGRIIEQASNLWGFADEFEISLEANPTDAEAARFEDLRHAGVERLSLGLQALDDASLKGLGRFHSAEEGLAAARLARTIFPRLSIDLIHTRQGQTLDAWQRELDLALTLSPDHISPYQLTIEDGTAFARAASRGTLRLPDNDQAADFYSLTQSVLKDAGFDAYEVSNHANGVANRSRHNVLYWTSQDWIGLGPGAHGRLGWGKARRATKAQVRPKAYCDGVTLNGHGILEDELLTPDAVRDEFWLMGLRLQDGVAHGDAPGSPLPDDQIQARVRQGLMWQTPTHLGLTAEGRLVADTIIAKLLAGDG
jgi:oxygen-independent coproporphyrinogen-3 oxidase